MPQKPPGSVNTPNSTNLSQADKRISPPLDPITPSDWGTLVSFQIGRKEAPPLKPPQNTPHKYSPFMSTSPSSVSRTLPLRRMRRRARLSRHEIYTSRPASTDSPRPRNSAARLVLVLKKKNRSYLYVNFKIAFSCKKQNNVRSSPGLQVWVSPILRDSQNLKISELFHDKNLFKILEKLAKPHEFQEVCS